MMKVFSMYKYYLHKSLEKKTFSLQFFMIPLKRKSSIFYANASIIRFALLQTADNFEFDKEDF